LNPHLPPDFIEINSRSKPAWWRRKYLEGSFEAVEGAVYPNFSSTLVEPFDIPKDWMKVIGMDHGLRNPTAVIFGAIDPKDSVLYWYREYYVPNRLVPEHAKYLKPMFDEIPPGTLYRMVADPSISNKTDPLAGKSVQGLYQEYGIYWSKANNNIEAGILKVNSYIERKKLKVFNTLTNTIREHMNYKFPELSMDDDKNLDEKPVKKNEHSCDAGRYQIMVLPDNPDDLNTISFSPPEKYGRMSIKEEYEEFGHDSETPWENWGY
jgi:hypothetical protein